jgi:hypothetical protein
MEHEEYGRTHYAKLPRRVKVKMAKRGRRTVYHKACQEEIRTRIRGLADKGKEI